MNAIHSLSLKVLVLALERIIGLALLHQVSQPLMFYSVECMRPMVYDLSTSFFSTMKQQLIDFKLGRIKNFGYASILSTFLFERVPNLSPGVNIPRHSLHDLA